MRVEAPILKSIDGLYGFKNVFGKTREFFEKMKKILKNAEKKPYPLAFI